MRAVFEHFGTLNCRKEYAVAVFLRLMQGIDAGLTVNC